MRGAESSIKLLRVAVRVEKLTRVDMQQLIVKPGLEDVRRMLEGDPQIREIVDTPLWLQVLYCATQIKSPADISQFIPRDRLYARYVQYALGREQQNTKSSTAPQRMLRWLGWLAAEMRRRNQSNFVFEDLDFSWLYTKRAQRAGRSVTALLGGILGGFFGWLIDEQHGLTSGLVSGILIRLLLSSTKERLEPVEGLELAWRKAKSLWVVVAFGFGLITAPDGLWARVANGLVIALLMNLMSIIQRRSVSSHTVPNRGTLRSLSYGLGFAVGGLFLAMVVSIYFVHFAPSASSQIVRTAARTIAILGGPVGLITSGGFFALQHYSLPFFPLLARLRADGICRFLNEATQSLFRIRQGGRFFHITFRDYIGETYGSPKPDRERRIES